MPRGDRTGPMGFGPLTGRGAGYCAGYPTPGNMRGFGMRGGRGRGFRRMMPGAGMGMGMGMGYWQRFGGYGPAYAADPKTALKQQADLLEEELSQVRQQLEQLDEADE